ncbi:hypothetical protein [Myxococcus sp. RHSTA-1-4]|uniref:hypothetical protein n=1 Tax=Myxococcus sp. RHSTA-1-4 TaxID=2874601 RepID=UPI001CBD733B|nr:hypothetical protein [Myxococcus sp. RHSTA-1-4]MBZ4419666.1 hypothetical protein [Myxococcus sp. RHSTA-1-4]
MAEMDFGGGAGALCPLHPAHAASSTCTRCGNFMCDTCSEGGAQALCPGCRERTGLGQSFPLTRGTWTVSALLDTAWAAFKRDWVMICVGVLIAMAGSIVGEIVKQILTLMGGVVDNVAVTAVFIGLGYLGSTVVQGVANLGLMRMLLDVLEGRKADLGRIFTQFHKAVPYLLTTLIIFAVMLPFLLLVFGAGVGAAAVTGGLGALESLDWTSLNEGNPSEETVREFGTLWPAMVAMLVVGGGLSIFPGMWLGMPLLLVQPELARSENPTAMATLRRCFAYARGHRLGMLGAALLGTLITFAGILACCVGLVPAAGLFNLMMAGLYLALSNGAEET